MVREQLKKFQESAAGLVLDYLMKVTVVIGLPIAGWFATTVMAHSEQIIHINASRYTSTAAAKDRLLEREDMKEFIRLNIDPIHSSLAEIKIGVKENRNAIRDTMR
jgi:hypothetical protein